MKKFLSIVGTLLSLVILLTLALSFAFGAKWIGLEWRGYWTPKEAAIEREIFYETRSYNEGQLQQLNRYRIQYYRTDNDNERNAIRSTIRMQFAEFDINRVSNEETREFLKEMLR